MAVSYLLEPISLRLSTTIRTRAAATKDGMPLTEGAADLSQVVLGVSQAQLRDGVRLVEALQVASREAVEAYTDPQLSEPAVGPRARWQKALRHVQHDRWRKRGWHLEAGYFEARRLWRLEYITLYKQAVIAARPLTDVLELVGL